MRAKNFGSYYFLAPTVADPNYPEAIEIVLEPGEKVLKAITGSYCVYASDNGFGDYIVGRVAVFVGMPERDQPYYDAIYARDSSHTFNAPFSKFKELLSTKRLLLDVQITSQGLFQALKGEHEIRTKEALTIVMCRAYFPTVEGWAAEANTPQQMHLNVFGSFESKGKADLFGQELR
jgi:hypothetical protein